MGIDLLADLVFLIVVLWVAFPYIAESRAEKKEAKRQMRIDSIKQTINNLELKISKNQAELDENEDLHSLINLFHLLDNKANFNCETERRYEQLTREIAESKEEIEKQKQTLWKL